MSDATRIDARTAAPRSTVTRLRRSSLGVKLAALGAVVTAAVVWFAFWALSVEIRGSTRDALASQLKRNQQTLHELQSRDAAQLLLAASLITQTASFQYDLNVYREEANATGKARVDLVNTIEDELRNRLRSVHAADLLVVTDDSGRVFASAAQPGVGALPRGMRVSSLDAVQLALSDTVPAEQGSQGVWYGDGGSFLVAAYGLVQDGRTLGALVLGHRLDSGFVAAAHTASEADVVVTADSTVIAASQTALAVPIVGRLLQSLARDSTVSTTSLRGEDYVAAPVRLGRTQTGATVRLWMLQPLSPRVAAVMRPLRRDFLLYGTLAVLVAALGAALVARTVLGPFHRFVQYMRSGAAAETRQGRFDASREAVEVRTLNESFNQLMDSLAVKRRELEARTAELVAANVVLTDEISERTRIEKALRESEAQLRQSQKLEAIGTLAGGIAHDFNNLITVISGYTQLALMRAVKGSAESDDLRQVIEASDRAANLTHQLLAFGRKQVLQPTVLDLGEVVNGIAPMLRRIIGEHIELEIEGDAPLARVRADKGQLEQVLLNLAVNARDAMPGGGTLTIATRNVGSGISDRGSGNGQTRNAVTDSGLGIPGSGFRLPDSGFRIPAVCLVVSDTGIGMSGEVKERIFEPFFTTKEVGKGTGLGLSTVYGIVNQSGGTIEVESELGHGTEFMIRLPAVEQMVAGAAAAVDESDLPRGTETILVVEDAEDVRILARRTLEERGYAVLVARTAAEALEIANARPVDVLLTDVVMPQTSGPQLVARYLEHRAAPVIIYMSGYADDALAQYELDPAIVFLRKPFTPALLTRTVREALDASGRRDSTRASAAAD